LLNEPEEIDILYRCSAELKIMRREVDDAQKWMGMTDIPNLNKTRRFIDRLTALT
jgi:hypothetical protein